jgi:pilus assembly protein FimV
MSRTLRLASAGLVAAAVLAITACGSSTSSGGVAGATGTPGTSPAASAAASASAEASAAASGLKQALLDFKSENGSTITGGAILTDLGNNQTAVTIGVVAAGVTDPMPASILPGDCTTLSTGGTSGSPAPSGSAAASAAPSAAAASAAASGSAEPSASAVPLNPGDVVKLGDLAAGSSNTVVSIGLDGLRSVPYAIVINKSATDTTVVACADVTQ